jgi:hypothetical protein
MHPILLINYLDGIACVTSTAILYVGLDNRLRTMTSTEFSLDPHAVRSVVEATLVLGLLLVE